MAEHGLLSRCEQLNGLAPHEGRGGSQRRANTQPLDSDLYPQQNTEGPGQLYENKPLNELLDPSTPLGVGFAKWWARYGHVAHTTSKPSMIYEQVRVHVLVRCLWELTARRPVWCEQARAAAERREAHRAVKAALEYVQVPQVGRLPVDE